MNRSRPFRAKVKTRRTRTSRRHFRATPVKSRISRSQRRRSINRRRSGRLTTTPTTDDPDKRKADSAFDDLYIEVDESELESELHGQPPDRKS